MDKHSAPDQLKHDRLLYTALFANFLLIGLGMTIIGSVLPKLIREFSWSYTATGSVLAAGSIGYFIASFVSGLIIQKLNARRLIVASLVLQALCLFLFARFRSPTLNFILNFLIGIGQGCAEVFTNYTVIRLERDGSSRRMNLMHAAFGIGAVTGPFITSLLISLSLGWKNIFVVTGLSYLFMAGAFIFVPFPAKTEISSGPNRASYRGKLVLLFLFVFSIYLYVGTELGISNWISEYFVVLFSLEAGKAASMVSVLWLGILSGRLYFSFLYRREKQLAIPVILAGMSFLAIILLLASGGKALAVASVYLTGLGFSSVYPITMTLAGRFFNNGSAVGFIATAGGIGSFSFPFLIAYVSDLLGIRGGFVMFLCMNGLLVAVELLLFLRLRKLDKAG